MTAGFENWQLSVIILYVANETSYKSEKLFII